MLGSCDFRIDEYRLFVVPGGLRQGEMEGHRDDEFVVIEIEHQAAAKPDALDHAAPDPRFGHFFTLARGGTVHKARGGSFRSIGGGDRRWM